MLKYKLTCFAIAFFTAVFLGALYIKKPDQKNDGSFSVLASKANFLESKEVDKSIPTLSNNQFLSAEKEKINLPAPLKQIEKIASIEKNQSQKVWSADEIEQKSLELDQELTRLEGVLRKNGLALSNVNSAPQNEDLSMEKSVEGDVQIRLQKIKRQLAAQAQ